MTKVSQYCAVELDVAPDQERLIEESGGHVTTLVPSMPSATTESLLCAKPMGVWLHVMMIASDYESTFAKEMLDEKFGAVLDCAYRFVRRLDRTRHHLVAVTATMPPMQAAR